MASNNGRQLLLALMEYHSENGRYPTDFDQLDEIVPDFGRLAWVRAGQGNAPEPFVLLRPGSTDIALDEDPLIVSPLLRAGTKIVVGYGDGSVKTLHAKMFPEIIGAVKEGKRE